jgi:hypothetical protein
MNRLFSRKRLFPSTFRPRLERVEERECPSCTVFQRGDELVILGDREANAITIADTREGDIAVTCDGGDPHRFSGVGQIVVASFGGDDSVDATFSGLSSPSFQFRAELGAGDDRLEIRGFDPQPDPPAQSRAFAINAGIGNDSVAFDLGSAEVNGQFFVEVNGGFGIDAMSVRAIIPCVLPESELRIAMIGGPGMDAIDASLTGLENEGGQFEMDLDGGEGNDRLSLDALDPCIIPGSRTRIAMSGGLGDDTIDATLSGLENEGGQFALEFNGGFGIDAMSVRAIIPCVLPESELRIAMIGGPGADAIDASLSGLENEGGRFAMDLDGGEGNDRLSLDAIDPCIVPGSRTRIAITGGADDDALSALFGGAPETRERSELDGALQLDLGGGRGDDAVALDLANAEIRGGTNVNVDGDAGLDQIRLGIAADVRIVGALDLSARGGIGNDVMESFIIPCILPEARGSFLFDGGTGDDRIDARVGMHEHDTGALAVHVSGGLGDDDLTLALSGTEFLLSLQAVVDGGDGHDVAHVTSDVRVVNCEEIDLLDGPR